MICPRCSSNIPDGSVRCPACRVDLSLVQTDFEITGTYCSSCGSLIPPGEHQCPSCNMPVRAAHKAGPRRSNIDPPELDDIDEPEDVSGASERTHSMARIKSAIPEEGESKTRRAERMPAARTSLVAALAALALVGGLAYLLTHPIGGNGDSVQLPWVDMSQVGSPGQIESLAGQDYDPNAQTEIISGDDATYQDLLEAYDELSAFAKGLDESEEAFLESMTGMSADERASAREEAMQLGLDISNLILELDKVDVTSGTYASDLENVKTLASWLRNRSDALTEGWTLAADSQDPAADEAFIVAPVKGSQNGSGVDAYKALFDKNYEDWRPDKR